MAKTPLSWNEWRTIVSLKERFEIILKRPKIRTVIGVTLIVYGASTLPIPTGSVPAILLGGIVLGYKVDEIKKKMEDIKYYFKDRKGMY
ncbi:MAG: hypothetical protein ACFFG0_10390 [Candidatus Thorarchaeota archaeon]